MAEILIQAERVTKYYPFGEGFQKKNVKAVDNVSFEIYQGETLGLVGESGCGKSTLGRVILRLREKSSGTVLFEGKDIYRMSSREMKEMRRNMQIIFQDPYACLNPRLTIGSIIAEPLKFHGVVSKNERLQRIKAVMSSVGLSEDMMTRYPHELSGGQQQRVSIARALILRPKFIVCDEAVSALDVSIQAQILNLLEQLKKEYQLTFLFISHNMAVVNHMCDRVAVMYLGRIVEIADKESLFRNPVHPYTKALMSVLLTTDQIGQIDNFTLSGDIPNPVNIPAGCRFHTRCDRVCQKCTNIEPAFVQVEPGHFVACHCCESNDS